VDRRLVAARHRRVRRRLPQGRGTRRRDGRGVRDGCRRPAFGRHVLSSAGLALFCSRRCRLSAGLRRPVGWRWRL